MNKEDIFFNTNEDIIYQIEMMSYDRYNYQIAKANEYLGDVYSYRDIEDMKNSQTQYEKELSYIAIEQLQQENKQLKECLNEIDLIFYRMRFVDLNSDKEWIKFINNCINDVRHICQNPINYKKGNDENDN